MPRITIDFTDEQAELIGDAVLQGEAAPYAFQVLGGEEFRRIIGLDMEEPVDLDAITREQRWEMLEECVRAYLRGLVANHLNLQAQARAQQESADQAAGFLT